MRPSLPRGALLTLVPALLCVMLALSALADATSAQPAQPARQGAARDAALPADTPTPPWPYDGAIDLPVASTGCGLAAPVAAGTTQRQTLAVNPATNEGASTREYWIHVPRGYAASQPTALVLDFHGGGGTALSAEASSGLSPFADQQRFLAVYPQGLAFSRIGSGFTTWAATGPLDTFANGVDDLRFVSDLLDELQRRYCVDPQRIYATGFSAGGAMTAFLTCGLTGRIAAFAPMSGDAYQFQGGCAPQHPTSIIEFHGAADPFELYAGIPAREDPDWRRTGVMEWLTTWAMRDGCSGAPSAILREPTVYAEQWSQCRNGVAVVHYRIAGLGHALSPPIDGRSAFQIIWDFFQRHPLLTA